LEQAQAELLDFRGSGMSILEMSHRSKTYEAVHQQTTRDLKALLGAGEDHALLYLGGGARTQFAAVPMNLLPPGASADYVTTGSWSALALAEARKLGPVREIWSSAATGNDRVPAAGELDVDPKAAYLHYTSNNTIAGTQYHHVPQAGTVPVVCDMSSDILSRPIDPAAFGVVYAGAQKNLGPAGVTLVLVRKDLLPRSSAHLPDTLSYAKMAAKDSLLNTPPVYAIYLVGLVAQWLLKAGGTTAIERRNEEKAAHLYGTIDASSGFYRPHAQPGSRSRMNVTFRLPSEDQEARFVQEATAQGLIGLKGHRSVGGIRASIYNATGLPAVQALTDFMKDFQKRNG
jgi:phosphoserine aminotransferase